MRAVQIITFLAFAVALLFGLHYYFWLRLVRDTLLPSPWRQLATGAIVALGLSLPLPFLVGRIWGRAAGRALAWPVFVWMGMILILLVTLASIDVLKVIAWAGGKLGGWEPIDPARRLFFRRAGAALGAGLSTALGALALKRGLESPTLRELSVPLGRLPRALDGMTVVQLTDLHVGPTIGRRFIEDLVARVNALRPDLVAITGDLVDGSVDELREAVAPLAGLRAPRGVYFVTGNHEYYSGVDAWIGELGRLGVRVLRNERVQIGESDASFDLAGIDDWNAHGMAPGHGPDLPRALDGRDPSRELVLLAHQPRAVHEAAVRGVGLQLSGHTHGGQIWPWGLAVRLQQPYVVGLSREGGTQIYVSPGTGYWGPPMRLGTRGEITRIVLRAVG
jgi:predicted MPP superfamily phosphohydrolase